MLLQAHSIEKFVVSPVVHHVYVQDDLIPLETWENMLSPIYKKNTLVLSHNKIKKYTASTKILGWIHQQYIKLMLASEMPDEYVLSLDSKNVFCNSIDIEKYYYGYEGQYGIDVDIYTSELEWTTYWKEWVRLIEVETKIKSPNQQFPCTPFVFKNSSLKKMNSCIDIKGLFNKAAEKEIIVSEYLLYNFFKDTSSLRLSEYNDPRKSNVFTIFRRDLDDNSEYKEATRKFLLSSGLEPNYVNPAIDLTSHKNR
jgi:hypothetical protein